MSAGGETRPGAAHWEAVYAAGPATAASWHRAHLELSLAWIERVAPQRDAAILDAGGGASTLVDDLLALGYRDLTVLDIAAAALAAARKRLQDRAARVHWVEADIVHAGLGAGAYDVWHDRAVFHFLTAASARRAYVAQLTRALKPGGHVLLATFAPEGPQRCSGLPVMRYHAAALQAEVGAGFHLIESREELHHTPGGTRQPFLYTLFRAG